MILGFILCTRYSHCGFVYMLLTLMHLSCYGKTLIINIAVPAHVTLHSHLMMVLALQL